MPTERLAPPDDWPSLGWEVISWAESMLRWDAGEFAGQQIEFNDEQVRFVVDAYRLYPQGHRREGERVIRRAVKSRPKGAGKSAEAKVLCIVEALGPAQFDGWDAAGEPVGRPRAAPFVRVMATEETQSITTVFGGVVEMLRVAGDEHPDVFGQVDAGLTRVYLPGGGQMRPSTASASSKDGGRETFVVVDEGHLWTSNELVEAYRTVRRNLAKRPGAWLLECSTMFAPGEGSIMEGAWGYAQQQLKQHDDQAFLWDHREGWDVDISDDDALSGSLSESYGSAISRMPVDEIMAEVRDPTTTPVESKRYFFNLRVAGDGQVLDPEVWAQRVDVDRRLEGPVALGFDGSRFRADHTGLVACTLDDPKHLVPLGHWVPVGDGERPPWEEIDIAVRDAMDRFDVALFYCDDKYWESQVDRWFGEWPKQVRSFPTGSHLRTGMMFRSFVRSVERGDITHDGDSDLSEHVRNAVRRQVKAKSPDEGEALFIASKDTTHSPRKIDLFYAAALAHEAACDAVANGYRARKPARLRSF